MEKDWVLVFETNEEYQAEIAREILENDGIDGVIINKKDLSSLAFGPIELYVHKDYAEKSIELLNSLKG